MFLTLILLQFWALPWLVLSEERIIDGNTVNNKDVPWYATVLVRSRLKCGGVLVSKKYILTAAKCVDGSNVRHIEVRLGTSSCQSGGTQVGICEVKKHPQYSHWRFDNNLALLRLCEPLTINDQIKPIKRIDKVPGDNAAAKVSGCGGRAGTLLEVLKDKRFFPILEDIFLQLPAQLYGTEVKIFNQRQCAAEWEGCPLNLMDGISDLTLCTKSSGRGACSYDMGSPLVVGNKLVGILSRAGCSIKPDVYSSILKHTSWLVSNTKE